MIERAIASEKLGSVTGPGDLASGEVGESDATAELGAPMVPRQHRSGFGIDRRCDERSRAGAGSSQHPFHVGGDRKPAGSPRMIADLQPGDLDRVLERYVLQKFERDAVRSMLETAVALAMPDDIGRGLFANRQRRGTPEFAAVFVANVEHFARPIADRIVGPRSDLILLAIDRPRVTAALDGYLEAEGGIGDDVDPRRRRPLPFAKDGYIFPAARGEAAKAVEKFELRQRRSGLLACQS